MQKSILLSILMLLSVFCKAQIAFKVDSTLKDYIFNLLSVNDGNKEVAYLNKDSVLFVRDSLATINVLIRLAFQNSKQFNNSQKKFYAATDILNYLKIDGTITNKKKFAAAIKEYMKLNTLD